jgi:homoserine kinase
VTWATGPVTVRVPATSANLGPGFDSFGLALTLHDRVSARLVPADVEIRVDGVGADTADAGEQHLIIRSMRAAFDVIGAQPGGIALFCRNEMPHGFGLGSSAAAIVAGRIAARALAGPDGLAGLPDAGLLRLATELEGHPDNVAACLLGGLTIAWQPDDGARAVRLEPLPGLIPVVCVPTSPLATAQARQVLPDRVPHADAAANSARAALLVAALTSRPDLLLPGTEDFLHQRYRADSMPATADLIATLRAAGIAAAVSGAGPSALALPADPAQVTAVATIAGEAGSDWQVLPLRIDPDGAQLLPAGHQTEAGKRIRPQSPHRPPPGTR